ncbi:MAG: hypothetical protein HYX78_08295 [Armatimonadetes bacterium]|nr:hypothetical protein [Armatimonadota bacterium]
MTAWTLADANGKQQTINAGLCSGQLIYLDPGEKVSFNDTSAPSWNWRAMADSVPGWSWRALVK